MIAHGLVTFGGMICFQVLYLICKMKVCPPSDYFFPRVGMLVEIHHLHCHQAVANVIIFKVITAISHLFENFVFVQIDKMTDETYQCLMKHGHSGYWTD